MTRRTVCLHLQEYFGPDLLTLSGKGVANVLAFRSKAGSSLRLVDDDEDESLEKIAKVIVKESKQLKTDKRTYETRIDVSKAVESCSDTALELLGLISTKFESSLPSVLIGNIITCMVTNQPTTLQIGLGILMRERTLVDHCFKFGITCSYDETIRFKTPAATVALKHSEMTGLLDIKEGLVQAVADNFDANISSPNGLKSTHSLALLMTQVHKNTGQDDNEMNETKIRRIKKEEIKNELQTQLTIQRYNGPKKPVMNRICAQRSILPLKILAQQSISQRRAK